MNHFFAWDRLLATGYLEASALFAGGPVAGEDNYVSDDRRSEKPRAERRLLLI